jgi:exodeoxyribonuclease VII small subunit
MDHPGNVPAVGESYTVRDHSSAILFEKISAIRSQAAAIPKLTATKAVGYGCPPSASTGKTMTAEPANFNFEHALKELEELVGRMEQGDLSLEESLKAFERGIELTRSCQQALKEAEQKVEILINKGDQARAVPFEEQNQ